MLTRPTWSWVSWRFRRPVSFEMPTAGNITTIYRADSLSNPTSTPSRELEDHLPADWKAHFAPNVLTLHDRLRQCRHDLDRSIYLGEDPAHLLVLLKQLESTKQYERRVSRSADLRQIHNDLANGISTAPRDHIQALFSVFRDEIRQKLTTYVIEFHTSVATLSLHQTSNHRSKRYYKSHHVHLAAQQPQDFPCPGIRR